MLVSFVLFPVLLIIASIRKSIGRIFNAKYHFQQIDKQKAKSKHCGNCHDPLLNRGTFFTTKNNSFARPMTAGRKPNNEVIRPGEYNVFIP